MADSSKIPSDFDGAWKEFLEFHFADFLKKFFIPVYREVDWSIPFEFLDQELREIMPEGSTAERRVDKLVKVFLKNGKEQWLLLHLEIQSFKESGFAERIYHYNHSIHRNWNHEVISLVMLADLNKDWNPREYRYQKLGCEIIFRFPTCKLLEEMSRLKEDFSLSAIAAKAQIAALRTSRSPKKRFDARWELVRSLYEHGFTKEEVREGYRLLSWMMILPTELTLTFREKLVDFEKANTMTYVTDIEQIGIDRGTKRILFALIEKKFGALEDSLRNRLDKLDVEQVEKLAAAILDFSDIAELVAYLEVIK